MKKCQLWSRDEYGTSSILGTFSSSDDALSKARALVTEANFSNSLSSAEQMRSVEAYLIELETDDGTYAGMSQNKHMSFKTGSVAAIATPESVSVNIYVGSKFENKTKNETRVYMKDDKGKPITSLNHASLKGKTVYFVRPIV